MKHGKFLSFLTLACAFTLTAAVADAKRTNRDLVFEDDERPAVAAKVDSSGNAIVVSMKTAVELVRNGHKSTVLPNHAFRSGDKVKFKYTVNTDCYAYWFLKGSSGSLYMLFPNKLTGRDNLIKKNQVCTIPVKGSFKFDNNPGKEEVLVFLTKERVPELDEASLEATENKGQVRNCAADLNGIQENNESRRTSRDLVFEEEEDTQSGIKTSSQASSSPDDVLVVYYALDHN